MRKKKIKVKVVEHEMAGFPSGFLVGFVLGIVLFVAIYFITK